MKTIWNAVNELKGNLEDCEHYAVSSDAICSYIYVGTYENTRNKGALQVTDEVINNGRWALVSSFMEFNALVTEMSLGLDVNPINEGYYHKYLDADKQELEPVPVIDWDNAPEGATHYWGRSNSFYKFSNFGDDFVFCVDQWDSCSDIECFRDDALIQRPAKKEPNIYTQEMSDNGELPPIGSMFIDIELDNEEQVEAMAHDLEFGRVIYKRGSTLQDSEYFGAQAHECKPIPPKLELIDGKAYQFDISATYDKEVSGIYSELKSTFSMPYANIHISKCTNIKLLTVSD